MPKNRIYDSERAKEALDYALRYCSSRDGDETIPPDDLLNYANKFYDFLSGETDFFIKCSKCEGGE